MKPTMKTAVAALMLLATSCTKESNNIQSSSITNESSAQAFATDVNEPATYASIKMDKVVGMLKNLTVSHYRNGDLIPQVKDPAKWAALTTGAWCWYNNDSATGHIYGKLYNWYAVNDPRGLAPTGWHIPSDSEWTALSKLLGGDAVAGGKMKSTGTIQAGTGLWSAPNTDATNSSGFTGFPGGFRNYDGSFYAIGLNGSWWSSTEYNTGSAWARLLSYYGGSISRVNNYKPNGGSVRCLKD